MTNDIKLNRKAYCLLAVILAMKSTKVQNPRRISYIILAYSHCKLVTVSRAARTQEGRVG